VDKIQENINKIKHRQEVFSKGLGDGDEELDSEKEEVKEPTGAAQPTRESIIEVKRLERRIGQLENTEMP